MPKECKYIVQEKKMPEYITDEIKIPSDDSDRENSDEENSNVKKILIRISKSF